MTKENWLPIPGYEGIYSVSDLGNVMSMDFANTGMLKLLRPRIGKGRNGYPRVCLYRNKKATHINVHRLVMLAFVGPCPQGKEVNHISGDKLDPRLVNLEYVTSSENRLHAIRIGIQVPAHGENHCRAKLSTEDVLKIIDRVKSGELQADIAREYGVHRSVISRVANGKRWVRTLASLQ